MTVLDVLLLLTAVLTVVMLCIGRQARIVCEELRAKRLALEEEDRRENARLATLLRGHRCTKASRGALAGPRST